MLESKDILLHHWYRCLYKGREELCCIGIESKQDNHILYGIHIWYNDMCITTGDLKHCRSILYQIIDQTYYRE